jgi:2-iminobutanoate/2-iminopropanoate deaminase
MNIRQIGLAMALATLACTASADDKKSCYQVSPFEKEVGYCSAVRSGNTLYISGAASGGEMPAAIGRVYGSLKKTLEAHGLSFADVVKENLYATDLDALIRNKDLRKAAYGDSFPAATWVQVSRLYTPGLVLEVELVATFPTGK